jgi:predicted DNA-binding protein (MmcQ/YjbR family)
MTLDTLRQICIRFEGVTEDVKWGHDLCFCVGGKMFAVTSLDPPHAVSFKCSPEDFGELIEREGIIPAPYLARAMWVQEHELGETLDRREFERLVRASYELVKAKLPKRLRTSSPKKARPVSRRSRTAPAAVRRRRR